MSGPASIYASGGLLTPGIIAELYAPQGRQEFSAGSFRGLDGEPVDDFELWIEDGFRQFCERHDSLADELGAMDRTALREKWALPLLRYLGWNPAFQQAHLRPIEIDDRTFPISHLGWDDLQAPPIHIEPTGQRDQGMDARPASRKNSPHDDLQQYLNLAPQVWGIVTNGVELRVVRDFHHSTAKGYVAVDLDALFRSRSIDDFRGLVRLAHVSRFLPGDPDNPDSDPPLESLYHRARAAGISVGKALHPQVRRSIELLASAAVRADRDLRASIGDATKAREFYGEVLRIVYRLLFLFFAEQRGILPGRGSLYADSYSVTRLRELAGRPMAIEGRRCDLYEGLKATFRLMHEGSAHAGVKPFGGQLFDAARTPVMSRAEMPNRDLLRAIASLSTIQAGGLSQHIAYATIGVEELGAVYESLLDYTPRIAEAPTPTEGGEVAATGSLYLEKIGDRELAAYYTPAELVDFTLEISLDRLIKERCENLSGREAEAAILDIRVIDPACGSGAFLVSAIDRLALALCDKRHDGQQPTEPQLARARRDVLQHCIYGVDLDPFAVELCKVALWIHGAARDLPLTFLDHRIQLGNSLIGWPLQDIPDDIPFDAYPTKSQNKGADEATKSICASARDRNKQELAGQGNLFAGAVAKPDLRLDYPILWLEEEKTPADVEKKADAYADYLESTAYRLWDAAANLWSTSFFWTADLGESPPTTSDYRNARRLAEQYRDAELFDEDAASFLGSPQAKAATEAARRLAHFHWPLRFPEIAERGGFDIVTGNPPWEEFALERKEWFATRDPAISKAATAPAKKMITALETTNPALAREWRLASQANPRQANFMRHSGRYTRSGGKPNTYLLFTEINAQNTQADARAAFIVKSGLGVDKGGQAVFQPLISQGRIEGFYDILNGGRGEATVFSGVAEVERFAVVSLGPERADERTLPVSMMNFSIAEARSRVPLSIRPAELSELNPVTRSLPSFRDADHLEIALRLHRRHPTLDFDTPSMAELESEERIAPDNPWNLRYAVLFNSSTSSGHFLKREELEFEGWQLEADMVFRRGDNEAALPLYEGQLVNRYDHRARTYAGYGPPEKKYGPKPGIPHTSDNQKANPAFESEPRYWMMRDTARVRIKERAGDRLIFGIRNVGSPLTNARSAIAAILPQWPATHALPVIAAGVRPLAFLAFYNSTTFDFLLRGKMPGGNAAMAWLLSQIACPNPDDHELSILESMASDLSATSHSVAKVLDRQPHRWDADERHHADTELDARVAHIYGLTAAEYEVVLDSFDVLARKEIEKHDSYRFKDDCLAAYRRLG